MYLKKQKRMIYFGQEILKEITGYVELKEKLFLKIERILM